MSESQPSRTNEPPPEPPGERDRFGRFAPGNVTSKRGGNPHWRTLAEAQDAVRAAGTPAQVTAVLAALHERALSGDVAAATAWLRRVLGRERDEVRAVPLPVLDSPAGIADALRAVAAAAADGTLGAAEANAVVATLRAIVDSQLLADLEMRLAAVERERGPA